jgi:hypothetical protein
VPTWIRVRDPKTGHEYDLAEPAVAATPDVEVIADYPPNAGPSARPRPAKHRVDKGEPPAGKPGRPGKAASKNPATDPAAQPATTEGAQR